MHFTMHPFMSRIWIRTGVGSDWGKLNPLARWGWSDSKPSAHSPSKDVALVGEIGPPPFSGKAITQSEAYDLCSGISIGPSSQMDDQYAGNLCLQANEQRAVSARWLPDMGFFRRSDLRSLMRVQWSLCRNSIQAPL